MLGSWVRAPASSPDDCRNAVVFFLFVVQLRCCAKRVFSIVCKHPRNPLLLRYAQHIHHKQNRTRWRLWVGGYLGRVFPHRASATFGTPSVTAKAVRAPKRRWFNCVATIKEYFRLYASILEILFSRDMHSISTTNKIELVGGFVRGLPQSYIY